MSEITTCEQLVCSLYLDLVDERDGLRSELEAAESANESLRELQADMHGELEAKADYDDVKADAEFYRDLWWRIYLWWRLCQKSRGGQWADADGPVGGDACDGSD